MNGDDFLAGSFQGILDAYPDGIIIHDSDGRIVAVNRRASENLGYDPDDIVGETIWRFAVDPDPAGVKQRWAELTVGDTERFEGEHRRKDGSTFPIEAHVSRLESADESRYLATVRDISERHRRIRELKQRNERLSEYQTMLQTVGDGVYMLDSDQRFRFVNDAMIEITGYSREELLGQHLSMLIGEAQALDSKEAREALIEHDDLATMEGEHRRADGQTFYGEVRFSPLYGEDGEFNGTAGVLRDVTERKEYERELERQNERLDEFAATLSHELRNPLTVAMGHVELARDDGGADHLDRVDQALNRMERMIEDLLTLARGGRSVRELEPVKLASLVERCWRTVDLGMATLKLEADRHVMADEGRLQHLIENLLRNAVEHGGHDVTVMVGDLTDGFYVEDDGPGIPEAARHKVFDAGYSTADTGTGLGLSIARDIAEAHGWEVAVTTGRVGGARFEFTGVETV